MLTSSQLLITEELKLMQERISYRGAHLRLDATTILEDDMTQ